MTTYREERKARSADHARVAPTGQSSCGASAAASSSSGSCCPCACGSTGGWAGSGPSSSRASAWCGTSYGTAAGGTRRERLARGVARSRDACVQRSADPRWGRRDATTGGAFWRRPVRRPAAIRCGARKSQGFLRDDATVRVWLGGPRSCSRASLGPRRRLCKSKELRSARAR